MRSKSTFMKKDENMDSFVREVKEKFWKLERRLHDHEQELSELKSRGVDNSYSTESDYKYQGKMQAEIERIRQEISSEIVRKDALDFRLGRFELELLDKFVGKKELNIRTDELKDRTNH